ncbi:MAG: ABC transporter permease [Chloroflexi bacterium]|nr:ABC transporter permease [Chloroflexota bacterium]
MNWRLFWRWAWRDLKRRWLQVAAISIIIAIGTGIYTGLGGEEEFRINSMDASYDGLNMYDIRVDLTDGSYLPHEQVVDALAEIEGIRSLEGRLIVPTQVDASNNGDVILVSGEIVGMDMQDGGLDINQVYINEGRNITEADGGNPAAVLDYKFARYYELEPGDDIHIAGNIQLDFVGSGQTPEYFMIIPESLAFFGEGSFAPIFMPLESVQQITGQAGMINNIVIVTDENADLEAVTQDIEAAFAANFAETGVDIEFKDDNNVRAMLYEDAKADQEIWDLMAFLFLAGAALAVFNLSGRMVQSQRREIGIAMALGVPRHIIALRPLMVGLQIAILGTIFGIFFGFAANTGFTSLIKDLAPLPYWDQTVHYPSLITGTIIGIVMPLVAVMLPTLRAVIVPPIDAIRSGHLVAKQGGLGKWLTYLPIPGKSFLQMPFRNIFRSPWRATFTVLGISVAIALITLFVGFLDSFVATMDEAELAYRHDSPNRFVVTLDNFYPVDSETVTSIGNDALFSNWETQLELGGMLSHNGAEFQSAITLLPMNSDIWTPMLLEGNLSDQMGTIVIADKMAEDLGVTVGDAIILEHPHREGLFSFKLVKSEVEVVGIHNNPLRPLSYMSIASQSMMGVEELTNQVVVVPVPGVSTNTVRSTLFQQAGVGSVTDIAELSNAFDDGLELFKQFLQVIQGVVIFMAFLIAFNATSINVDERVREIATMFAFGLPIRTVTRMQIVENLLIGIAGTIVGVGFGWFILQAMMSTRIEEQLDDLRLIATLQPETLLISLALGILVVGLTPLLSIRKMVRMDIPGALRVME